MANSIAVPEPDQKNSGVEGGTSSTGKKKSEAEGTKKPDLPQVSFFGLFRYADKLDIFLVVVGFLASALQGSVMPATMFLFGRIIEDLSALTPACVQNVYNITGNITGTPEEFDMDQVWDRLTTVITFMAILGVAACIVGFVQMAGFGVSARRQTARIRAAFFTSAIQQDQSWYDTEGGPTAVAPRITSDVSKISLALGEKLSNAIFAVCGSVFSVILALIVSWRMALVILATAPLLMLTGVLLTVTTTTAEQFGLAASAHASTFSTDILQGIKTIITLNAQRDVLARYRDKLLLGRAASLRRSLYSGLGLGTMFFIVFAVYALGFWWAAWLVANSPDDGIGTTLSAFFLIVMGLFTLGTVSTNLTEIASGRAAAAFIFHVIESESKIRSAHPLKLQSLLPSNSLAAAQLPPLKQRVAREAVSIGLSNVTMSYASAPDVIVLDNLSISIPAGKTIALVGQSGCGKSSALALIARLYDPISGKVTFNGVDVKTMDLAEVRDLIGYVGQEPVLFSGSVLDNVRFARPTATEAEVEAACRSANIHAAIMALPNGYHTDVGEGGSQFSGGQKQRIAIARAIISEPSILLLDEATSALDAESEAVVREALEQVGVNRTVVMIAHRLASVRHADIIYTLGSPSELVEARAQGNKRAFEGVLEVGTHESLVAEKGKYYGLALSQGLVDYAPSRTSPVLKSPTTDIPVNDSIDAAVATSSASSNTVSSPLTRVANLVKQSRWAVFWSFVGLFGAFIVAGVYPIWSLIFSNMVKIFSKVSCGQQDQDEINLYASAFILVALLSFFGNFLQVFGFQQAGNLVTFKLRVALFKHILRQDGAFFDEPSYTPAATTTLLSEEADKVHNLFGPNMGLYVRVICALVLAVGIAFATSWRLTLVMLSLIPLLAFGSAVQNKFMANADQSEATTGVLQDSSPKTRDASTSASKENNKDSTAVAVSGDSEHTAELSALPPSLLAARIASECLRQVKTISMLHMEPQFCVRYTRAVGRALPLEIRNTLIGAAAFGISQFSINACFSLAFWYGGKIVRDQIDGITDFEPIMLVAMIILMSAVGMGEASQFAGPVSAAKGASQRIFTLLDRVPAIDVGENLQPPLSRPSAFSDATIEFIGVKFRYPQRPTVPVLSKFFLTVPDGEFGALVGESGCGKSTVVSLLQRLYNIEEGSIRLGGKDISEVNPAAVRDDIGVVAQEPVLFEASVRDNILGFADPVRLAASARASSRPEPMSVEEACRYADIHDVIIALPDGYDTMISSSRLSGGQKQRIAIARAIMRRPRILLMDEATSALDSATELEVQSAIDAIVKELHITVVSVAHRLASINAATVIAVVQSGRVIEVGDRETLLASKGAFAARWATYAGGEH